MEKTTERLFAEAADKFADACIRGVAILERVEKRIVKKMDDDDVREKQRERSRPS